jgi:hypothetical protein
MHAIAAGPSGLVAVGAGPLGAAVWTSPDGMAWTRVSDASGLHGGEMRSIAHGSTFVAVGTGPPARDGSEIAAAWTSSDGATWRKAPTVDGFHRASFQSVIPWRDGFVAVAIEDESPTAVERRVWRSADGLAWHPGTIVGDIRKQNLQLTKLASNGSRLVAIDTAGLSILTSDDGSTWRPIPDMTPFQSGDGEFDSTLEAIASTSDGGYVIVGQVAQSLASWTSPDGIRWTRARDQDALAPGDNGGYAISTLIDLPSGLLGVGMSPHGDSVESWTSRDGLDWQRQASQTVPFDVIGTFAVEGTAAVGDRLVAAGTYPWLADWMSRRAAAWVSPIPPVTAIDTPPPAAACGSVPPTLAGILSISPQDRLRCFGRRTLHLTGWQPSIDTDECPGFGPELHLAGRLAAAFAGCTPGVAVESGPGVRWLSIALAPATGYTSEPPGGRRYSITGHFDDAAASGCSSTQVSVADCRTVFVATSYKRIH